MTGIYSGIRVLEMADFKGMYCGRFLAQLGAEVIKIERPGGDGERMKGPFAPGESDKKEKSLPFIYLNMGKKDMTLDITQKKGRDIFLKLLATADVVIETFKPGQMKEWGLGYDDLKAVNPGIIMVSITAFGQDGRHSQWEASTDLIPDAMGGGMADMGYFGRSPLHMGYDIMSNVCGLYGSFAVQAAIASRIETGQGTYIDISQQEAFSIWRSSRLGEAMVHQRDFPLVGGEDYVRQGLINCKDGFAHLMLGVGKFGALLDWFEEMGIQTDIFRDAKYEIYDKYALAKWDHPLLNALNQLGSAYTKTEFMEEAQRRKLPGCAVESADSILDNCQLKARGYFVEVDHPVIGAFKYPGSVAKMSEAALIVNEPASLLGENNGELYSDLGFSDDEIGALQVEGII